VNAFTSLSYTSVHSIRRKGLKMSASPLEDKILIEYGSSGIMKAVKWNNEKSLFIKQSINGSKKQETYLNFIKNCFVPSGIMSSDYYVYSLWRSAQRFVSATSSVFGTQALLLSLGYNSDRIGLAVATRWVLKDALGKFSRVYWASTNGRKFDSDAKKWRFRSSLLFAVGNALEIFTYIVPSLFLLVAALANALKQMAMVTSSATRNAIYKSFARKSDNIGDITAKGESQIAVSDLLGLATGVLISKAIGASRSRITGLFIGLSMFDLLCIFKEVKSVVFTSLNFERTALVLSHLLSEADVKPLSALIPPPPSGTPQSSSVSTSKLDHKSNENLKIPEEREILEGSENDEDIITLEDENEVNNTKNLNHSIQLNDDSKVIEKEIPKLEGNGDLGRKDDRTVYLLEASASVALTPKEVAVMEPIFDPTRFGEDTFRYLFVMIRY
jgi:hypothetical protein